MTLRYLKHGYERYGLWPDIKFEESPAPHFKCNEEKMCPVEYAYPHTPASTPMYPGHPLDLKVWWDADAGGETLAGKNNPIIVVSLLVSRSLVSFRLESLVLERWWMFQTFQIGDFRAHVGKTNF